MGVQHLSFFIQPLALKTMANVSNQRLIPLDGGICVFLVELFETIEVIVISREIKKGECIVQFFDKEIYFSYGTYLYIDFDVVGISTSSVTFDIKFESSNGSSTIGRMVVDADGKVLYNGEPIKTEESRRLSVKAALLG